MPPSRRSCACDERCSPRDPNNRWAYPCWIGGPDPPTDALADGPEAAKIAGAADSAAPVGAARPKEECHDPVSPSIPRLRSLVPEMYYALRRLGKKVTWVNYLRAGHGAGRAGSVEDFHDHWNRMFERYGTYFADD